MLSFEKVLDDFTSFFWWITHKIKNDNFQKPPVVPLIWFRNVPIVPDRNTVS